MSANESSATLHEVCTETFLEKLDQLGSFAEALSEQLRQAHRELLWMPLEFESDPRNAIVASAMDRCYERHLRLVSALLAMKVSMDIKTEAAGGDLPSA